MMDNPSRIFRNRPEINWRIGLVAAGRKPSGVPHRTARAVPLIRETISGIFLRVKHRIFHGLLIALCAMALVGCGKPEAPHAHAPGTQGGFIVPVGRDHYHAEIVFLDGGVMKFFMLGHDETQVQEVELQEIEAFVRAPGATASTPVAMKPDPQPGDSAGKTSVFVGQLPEPVNRRQLIVVVPSIRIADQRYRFEFATNVEVMPMKVTSDAERDLYLTAAGKYSDADIAANNSQTASEKFAGFQSAHDMHPQPGDRICPITHTKANPACTWIVDGQEYQFCCPPCVDEFVKRAKSQPDEIQPARSFIKK
jgi:hypothetical protein